MPQRKKKRGGKVKRLAGGGPANDGAHQSRQRLQQPASTQQQQQTQQDQVMSELLSNLTLRRVEGRCVHGSGLALAPLPPRLDNFITELHILLNLPEDDPSGHTPFAVWQKIMLLEPRFLYPDCEDTDAREVLVDCLVSLGTNYLLDESKSHALFAGLVAQTILYVEMMSGAKHCFDYRSKIMDLLGDEKREITKFFHKRNGCTCLKEDYERLRTMTKMGKCFHCSRSCECKQLMLCTQCKIYQYCSVECQRRDWPDHRDWCNQLRVDRAP
jgi:hypothetical protein